jgi:hypothetical protein
MVVAHCHAWSVRRSAGVRRSRREVFRPRAMLSSLSEEPRGSLAGSRRAGWRLQKSAPSVSRGQGEHTMACAEARSVDANAAQEASAWSYHAPYPPSIAALQAFYSLYAARGPCARTLAGHPGGKVPRGSSRWPHQRIPLSPGGAYLADVPSLLRRIVPPRRQRATAPAQALLASAPYARRRASPCVRARGGRGGAMCSR